MVMIVRLLRHDAVGRGPAALLHDARNASRIVWRRSRFRAFVRRREWPISSWAAAKARRALPASARRAPACRESSRLEASRTYPSLLAVPRPETAAAISSALPDEAAGGASAGGNGSKFRPRPSFSSSSARPGTAARQLGGLRDGLPAPRSLMALEHRNACQPRLKGARSSRMQRDRIVAQETRLMADEEEQRAAAAPRGSSAAHWPTPC